MAFIVYGHGGVTWEIYINLKLFSFQKRLHIKFVLEWPRVFRDENVCN